MFKRLLYNGGSEFVLDVHRLHQAYATRAIDERVLPTESFQLAAPVSAHMGSVLHQILIENGFDRCYASSTGNGVAAKGRAMIARGKHIGAWPGQHCTDRYAASQPLRHRDDIRCDAVVLPTKEFPCPTHTSLHLVADHHQVLLITPLAHTSYKCRVTRPDTTLALYRLEQYAYRFLACSRLQSLQVVIRHLFETIWQGYPRCLVECLSRGRGRRQGAPVEAALHTDNFIGTITMHASILACQLDRSLVGLRAAIAKE